MIISIHGDTFTVDDMANGYAKLQHIAANLYNFIDNHKDYNISLVYDRDILSRVRFIDGRVEVVYYREEDLFELIYNIDYIFEFQVILELTSAVLGEKIMNEVIPYYSK